MRWKSDATKRVGGRLHALLRLSGWLYDRWYLWVGMALFAAYVTVAFATDEIGGACVPGAVTVGCLL